MREKSEDVIISLCNAEQFANIKANPIVKATVLSLLKAVPILGDFLDSCIDVTLNNFQQKKRNTLIKIILSDEEKVTSNMVNDVEFIMNFAKTLEVVNKLSTNDKVEYFGNLLRNSYLTDKKNSNDEFDEYLNILNTLSYREIQYICFLYNYQKENYKKCEDFNFKINHKYFNDFGCKFGEHFGLSKYAFIDIFKKLVFTGFVQEVYMYNPGPISHNIPISEYQDEFTISEGDIDTDYFIITESLENFIKKIIS